MPNSPRPTSDTLRGKTALIMGVANNRSIGWHIAEAMHGAGAQVALTYQNERFGQRVIPLAEGIGGQTFECDVSDDAQIDALFTQVQKELDSLDCLVHSLAFAPRDALANPVVDCSREGFRVSLEVSAYSLIAVARSARPLLREQGGSILTLTYLGGERVVPGYNIMGVAKATLDAIVRYLAVELAPENIRVNALSPGPIRTLAASGVPGFATMLERFKEKAPMGRATEPAEVGEAAVFLASDAARGVTGQVLYLDAGYRLLGV